MKRSLMVDHVLPALMCRSIRSNKSPRLSQASGTHFLFGRLAAGCRDFQRDVKRSSIGSVKAIALRRPLDSLELAVGLAGRDEFEGIMHSEPGVGGAAERHREANRHIRGDWRAALANGDEHRFIDLQMLGDFPDGEVSAQCSPVARWSLDETDSSSTPSGGGLKSLDVTG